MHEDDILREIREYREAYAARFHYDVDAMCRDLRERGRTSGHPVVSFATRRPDRPSDETGPAPHGVEAEHPASGASVASGPAEGRR